MAGQKTHEQQLRIIEKREDTSNAGPGFDAEADLKMSKEERDARRRGSGLDGSHAEASLHSDDADDRSIPRGAHQESEHNKHRADD